MKLKHNFNEEESLFMLNVLIPAIKKLDIKKSNIIRLSNKYNKYVLDLTDKNITINSDDGISMRCCIAFSVDISDDSSQIEINFDFFKYVGALEKELQE